MKKKRKRSFGVFFFGGGGIMLHWKITPVEIWSMAFLWERPALSPTPDWGWPQGLSALYINTARISQPSTVWGASINKLRQKKKKCLAAQHTMGKYWCSCSGILLICACLTARLVPTERLSHSMSWLSCSRTQLGKPPGEVTPLKLGPVNYFASLTSFLSYFP